MSSAAAVEREQIKSEAVRARLIFRGVSKGKLVVSSRHWICFNAAGRVQPGNCCFSDGSELVSQQLPFFVGLL